MLSFLGFAVQAAATQRGPVQNLLDFLDDPGRNNLGGVIAGVAKVGAA